jgi:hypothetical protein
VEETAAREPKDAIGKSDASVTVDEREILRLFGEKQLHAKSAYFIGAPIWTADAKERLNKFVSDKLRSNAMFGDSPKAREYVARKVSKAIESSPNLTAMFLPYIKRN